MEAECARYEYFFDVIGKTPPDLAIVALDADKNRALQMIGQLSVEHPKLPILTISQDHQALLQSLQRGAKYFLTHPVGLEDMLAALRRALGEAGVSISSMAVGPDQRTKTALMVVSTEIPTPTEVIERLRDTDGIQDIHLITLR